MGRKIKLFCIFAIFVVLITLLIFILLHKDDLKNKENLSEITTEETANLLIIEPDYINPLVSKNKYVQEISNLVFDGLTKVDDTLKPQLALAKTFIPDDTLTNWTVTLKDNIFFHDGSKLTVDDVIYTVNKIKELESNSYFYYNVQNIVSMEKKSDMEMIFRLEKADNFLMSKMDLPILSKNYYSNKSLENTNKYIGTGTYKQIEISNTGMKLQYFSEHYEKCVGNVKNINVKIITNPRPGFELLKLDEIDFADTNIEVGAYGRSAYNSKKYITSIFEAIIFNENNEALMDKVVRQAILLGLNRDVIIENYLNGYGISTDLPINPNSYLYNKELVKYSYNPERAQDILTNNGWILNSSLGFRNKGNLKLDFSLLVNEDSKNATDKANFIKENLKKIGININIVTEKLDKYNLDIELKKYDMALTDWAISEYPEFLYNFETNSNNNIFGFSNEDYDYYVFLAKTEYLEGKSREYFNKMQEILSENLPMIGLYFETSTIYYNKKFEGELKSTINDVYSGIYDMIAKSI